MPTDLAVITSSAASGPENRYADFLLGYLNTDTRLLSVNVNHLLATSYGFLFRMTGRSNRT